MYHDFLNSNEVKSVLYNYTKNNDKNSKLFFKIKTRMKALSIVVDHRSSAHTDSVEETSQQQHGTDKQNTETCVHIHQATQSIMSYSLIMY